MKRTDEDTQFVKTKRTKIAEYAKRNLAYGVFLVALIGICAVTVIGVLSKNPSIENPNNTQNPSQTHGSIIDNNTPPVKTPTPVATPTPPAIDPTPDSEVGKNTDTKLRIVLPFAKKTIINDFSGDQPVYSETLDEWSCHTGVDLSCNQGDEVGAAANGIVVSVTTDSLYGTSVLVSHMDDFYTLYCGLKDVSVKVDELVSEGQKLGLVSGDVPCESLADCHIHFEVKKDGLSINPSSLTK